MPRPVAVLRLAHHAVTSKPCLLQRLLLRDIRDVCPRLPEVGELGRFYELSRDLLCVAGFDGFPSAQPVGGLIYLDTR